MNLIGQKTPTTRRVKGGEGKSRSESKLCGRGIEMSIIHVLSCVGPHDVRGGKLLGKGDGGQAGRVGD